MQVTISHHIVTLHVSLAHIQCYNQDFLSSAMQHFYTFSTAMDGVSVTLIFGNGHGRPKRLKLAA